MKLLAIDPGPVKSAIVGWDGKQILVKAIQDNNKLIWNLPKAIEKGYELLVIEKIMSYGMTVGASVFETVFWTGRFVSVWPAKWDRMGRLAVKMHLCHSPRAKDSNIRQVLIDRFGEPGTKKKQGILYGIKKDLWAALALAVAYVDLHPKAGL